jgi:hypothetical protein
MHVPGAHKPQQPRGGATGSCDPMLLRGDRHSRIVAQFDRGKQTHMDKLAKGFALDIPVSREL